MNENEVKFIIKSDSTYRATHSKEYLDSVDHARNRITLLKIAFLGVENYKRKTERTISINPLMSMFRPLMPVAPVLQWVEAGFAYLNRRNFYPLTGK